jgi:HEAT repeats
LRQAIEVFYMRLKIIGIIVLAGFAGLAGILLLKRSTLSPPSPPSSASPHNQSVQPAFFSLPAAVNDLPATNQIAVVQKTAAVATNADEAHEVYVQNRIAELQELQTRDDVQSLQAILGELTNSDKTIRQAAIDATTQFGSRDAIPVLKDLAARTPAPDEKAELLDAADFLALPSLTEVRQQNPHLQIHLMPSQPNSSGVPP